jgi:hypothetical protein
MVLRSLALLIVATAMGCATGPYRFGRPDDPDGIAVQRRVIWGEAAPKLDRWEAALYWPMRLPFLPEKPADRPSPETLEALEQYLDQNGIHDLNIAIDEYSPSEQWWRTMENRQVGALCRYPCGMVTWLAGTLLPDRVFNRTGYDPFSNTLVVNCDNKAEILAAAASAKELRRYKLRGAAAVMPYVPFASLTHHGRVTQDVVTYARMEDDWELERGTYELRYPLLGAESVGTFVFSSNPFATPIAGFAGHLAGQVAAKQQIRKRERQREMANAEREINVDSNPDDVDEFEMESDDVQPAVWVMPVKGHSVAPR